VPFFWWSNYNWFSREYISFCGRVYPLASIIKNIKDMADRRKGDSYVNSSFVVSSLLFLLQPVVFEDNLSRQVPPHLMLSPSSLLPRRMQLESRDNSKGEGELVFTLCFRSQSKRAERRFVAQLVQREYTLCAGQPRRIVANSNFSPFSHY